LGNFVTHFCLCNNLKEMKLILGSQSPRRQQLLRDAGFNFELRIKDVNEIFPNNIPVAFVPEYLAKLKAEAYFNDLSTDEILLTCDTIVIHDNEIFGKPKDDAEAIEMLLKYSENSHTVVSGVCFTHLDFQQSLSVHTEVFFDKITYDEACNYVKKYKPFDKAGAYAIQEWIGYRFIHSINGCYYNVMGLPISAVSKFLNQYLT